MKRREERGSELEREKACTLNTEKSCMCVCVCVCVCVLHTHGPKAPHFQIV